MEKGFRFDKFVARILVALLTELVRSLYKVLWGKVNQFQIAYYGWNCMITSFLE
jgi:hypothetical protein